MLTTTNFIGFEPVCVCDLAAGACMICHIETVRRTSRMCDELTALVS